jgi:hypothetical protein
MFSEFHVQHDSGRDSLLLRHPPHRSHGVLRRGQGAHRHGKEVPPHDHRCVEGGMTNAHRQGGI